MQPEGGQMLCLKHTGVTYMHQLVQYVRNKYTFIYLLHGSYVILNLLLLGYH
jgi:hypothetical protein